MKKLLLVLLTVSIFVGCHKDPKQYRITDANKDHFMEEIKPLTGLTVEEAGLLYGYTIRTTMAGALGQKPPSPVGKTVGELIATERDLQDKAKKESETQEKLAKEALVKEEANAAGLRKALTFAVYAKDFQPANTSGPPGTWDFKNYLVLKCTYQNTSGKDIRAFTGRIRFTDLFDKEVLTRSVTISDPVTAGTTNNWTGTLDYNDFQNDLKALRNANLTDLKVVWLPKQIIFADGSRIGSE